MSRRVQYLTETLELVVRHLNIPTNPPPDVPPLPGSALPLPVRRPLSRHDSSYTSVQSQDLVVELSSEDSTTQGGEMPAHHPAHHATEQAFIQYDYDYTTQTGAADLLATTNAKFSPKFHDEPNGSQVMASGALSSATPSYSFPPAQRSSRATLPPSLGCSTMAVDRQIALSRAVR